MFLNKSELPENCISDILVNLCFPLEIKYFLQ